MDHEYELEEDYAPRILWGRIAFFALALILAFVAGRACAPSGADPADYAARGQQIQDLTEQNELLQAQLSAKATEAPNSGGGGGNKNNNNQGGEEDPTEDAVSGEGETYTVESGDTLFGIAEKVYGDARKADLITDANNLSSDTPLRVGQELIIPPDE